MSEAQKDDPKKYRIPEASPWGNAWKVTAGIALVGAGLTATGLGDMARLGFSYLYGLSVVLTVAFGAVFFVLLQHLTGAGWSVTVRRTSEFFVGGMPAVVVLCLPLFAFAGALYPWWSHGHDTGVAHAQEHGEEHGHGHAEGDHGHGHGHDDHGHGHGAAEHGEHGAAAHHGGGHHTPEHAAHAAILEKKIGYLNPGFFSARFIVYLIIWLLIATFLFKHSTAQDASGDTKHTILLQRWAPGCTIGTALTTTFAAFDWILSLEPHWYSTMFGVRLFAASILTSLPIAILVTKGFRSTGILKNEVNVEHYHDLGKLMFGFLVFWAYISFSEFFLIWYAAIPEETIYFHRRWDHDTWRTISISLVVLKFIVPFYLVMSRNVKRKGFGLALGAGWILVMHMVEMYYWIVPYAADNQDVSFVLADVGCLLLVLGIYLTVVFRRMLNHPVIPVKDPRLERALHFVNA